MRTWKVEIPDTEASDQDTLKTLSYGLLFKHKIKMTATMMTPWTIDGSKDFELGPTGCGCHFMSSWNEDYGVEGKDGARFLTTVWNCEHGLWQVCDESGVPDYTPAPICFVRTPPKRRMPRLASREEAHDWLQCPGSCAQHPLMTAGVLQLVHAGRMGLSWGEIAQQEWDEMLATETEEQRAKRLAADAARAEAQHQACITYSTNKKVTKWCSGGSRKFRVPRVCRYDQLFRENKCARCEKPCADGKCSDERCGEAMAGCWAHDVFMCCNGCPPPVGDVTAEEMKRGCPTCGGATDSCCIYVHADEPQYPMAVAGTLLFDRDANQFYLRGEPRPAPLPRAPERRDERRQHGGHGRPQGGFQRREEHRPHGGGGFQRREEHQPFRSSPLARPAPAAAPAARQPNRAERRAAARAGGAFGALASDSDSE